jgi:redox-sensitive bicupin YhaK (pirin superfamily)
MYPPQYTTASVADFYPEELIMNTAIHHESATVRRVSRIIKGMPATDGAGVELTRVIGQPALPMLDPFLLLDAFRSDRPEDYLAGFPPHPHRGFETVTYLLAGRMRHRDNAGHEGVIAPGGIQWMTAGRGIVHSEMPEQENGLLEGFQLWVNLPAAHKMDQPGYQEYPADQIPVESRERGIEVRVIAGVTSQGTRGPVVQPLTEPLYLDVRAPAGGVFTERLPDTHNAFVYVIQGPVRARDTDGRLVQLGRDDLGVLARGDVVRVEAGNDEARFLVVAGRPLNEPVARGGPFVMNTRAEIQQAFEDYGQGRI